MMVDQSRTTDIYLKRVKDDWSTLKNKHKDVLDAHQINFNKDLHGLLEKRRPLYKDVSKIKLSDIKLLARSKFSAIKTNGNAIKDAAQAYKTKIHGLGGRAETELTVKLDWIINEVADYDIQYATTMLTPRG